MWYGGRKVKSGLGRENEVESRRIKQRKDYEEE